MKWIQHDLYTRSFILFIAFLLFTAHSVYSQAEKNGGTQELIISAENFFKAREYDKSLETYEKALKLKPGDKQLTERIAEIRKLKDNQHMSFEDAVLQGEDAFKGKDYPKAKKLFEKALELDPTAKYPKDRLAAIRAVYTDPADIARFNDAMNKGNQELASGNFDKARNWFELAIATQPDSKPAKDKLAETDRKKAEMISKKQQLDKLLAEADKLLAQEKREDARKLYEQASTLLPSDPRAAGKMLEIDNFLKAKKDRQDAFDKAIEAGDQFYINRDFANARSQYEEALKIKPEARYPREMLDKTSKGMSQVQADQAKYDAAIAVADASFKNGKLDDALPEYRTALSFASNPTYAQGKINEIEQLIKDKNSRREAYNIALSNGDQSFSEKNYEAALGHYRNALTLMPGELYPKEKIETIKTLQGNLKNLETAYNKAIQEGDARLKEKRYDEALTAYNNALQLKPGESYPSGKIAEITLKLEQAQNLNNSYAETIKKADQSYQDKQLEAALASYKEASALKPTETYPKSRITAINSELVKIKADQDKYDQLIAQADQFYSQQKYNEALGKYQNASVVKPGEQYPIDRITAINLIMKDNKARQEMYTQALSTADRLYADKQYERALAAYQEAKSIKPEEAYPAQKISEVNAKIQQLQNAEAAYTNKLALGDSLSASGNYSLSLNAYQEASVMKPTETYPISKIKEIKEILAGEKARDEAFDKAVVAGDEAFGKKNYEAAISQYEVALSLKPAQKYPADQVNEAKSRIAESIAKQAIYDQSVSEGEQKLKEEKYGEALIAFQKALDAKPAETYPRERINEITATQEGIRKKNESYARAIADGDFFFNQNKFREALEPYERASTIKPEEEYPKQQKGKINEALAAQKILDDKYLVLINEAEELLTAKKYQLSINKFEEASALKKEEPLPAQKIQIIRQILADIQARDEAYNKALAEGDAAFAGKDLNKALKAYENALTVKPSESYPASKISSIKAELKAIDDQYLQAIKVADASFSEKNYSDALNQYQAALDIKPSEKYPADKLAEINNLLIRQKEEQEKLYLASVTEGDSYLAKQNYVDARRAFMKASGLKPSESYPREKLIEINLVLDARAKALKDEYDKVIVDADRLYQQKILDQAIEGYEKAEAIKPDEKYPGEMIRKIKQYIADHSILEVNNTTILIPAGDEKKFTFSGIEPRLRNNNYVMLRAKAVGTAIPKVYFNYGRDNAKNGGIVLRTISTKEGVDYLIRLAGQDKWYREDNNWISLYTEGCDLEVSKIEISQGE